MLHYKCRRVSQETLGVNFISLKSFGAFNTFAYDAIYLMMQPDIPQKCFDDFKESAMLFLFLINKFCKTYWPEYICNMIKHRYKYTLNVSSWQHRLFLTCNYIGYTSYLGKLSFTSFYKIRYWYVNRMYSYSKTTKKSLCMSSNSDLKESFFQKSLM